MSAIYWPRWLVFFLLTGCQAPHPNVSSVGQEGVAFKGEISFSSDGRTLRGWLIRPAGASPFPAIIYNHGSERDPSLIWMGATANFFQAHGYVAFFPFRRGAGGSEGPYWKDVAGRGSGDPEQALVAALDAENVDVVEAVKWLKNQPFVDAQRVAVAGCSFGGIHSVLAAEKPIGLVAAIDFAGASMSWKNNQFLQNRLKRAVAASKIPIFFAQAANDFDTSPSRILSAEMARAGKPNRMKIYPKHGETPMAGHAHFCNYGQAEWGEDTLAFLRELAR